MHADKNGLNELSGNIIGSAFAALNTPGVEFLKKVYENTLTHELRKRGYGVAQQRDATVRAVQRCPLMLHMGRTLHAYPVSSQDHHIKRGPCRNAVGGPLVVGPYLHEGSRSPITATHHRQRAWELTG